MYKRRFKGKPLKNGLLATFPPLTSNADCDVIVLGGGITGALIAHTLCKKGVAVVVIDKRDIGWGSTSASTAMLQYEIDTELSDSVLALETQKSRLAPGRRLFCEHELGNQALQPLVTHRVVNFLRYLSSKPKPRSVQKLSI